MTNSFSTKTINSFLINASKFYTSHNSPERYTNPHIHDLCEIYVNISGNVSFVVEKNIYNIQAGDILITKPYEYHHCVYHDESDHEHFWILFSSSENPELFDFFLSRKSGSNNIIRLSDEMQKEFIRLCETLTKPTKQKMSAMATFFEIMSFVEKGMTKYNVQEPGNSLPQSLQNILDYISKNFATIKTVNQIADHFGISLSTLERYFKKNLAMTPKRYLEDKKLQNARDLLLQKQSVTYACFESGFDDYSHFITIFKKRFQTTPFQYKKNV